MEEGIPKEIANLIYKIPVVLFEMGQCGVIAVSQNCQMGL